MSEGIDALISAEGFAGYGRWMRLLEIVAFKMDKSERCYAEFSMQKWCQLLGLKQKKLSSFLELTKNQLKTKVVCSENIIRIEIPNLLKKRDNYTSDLEVTTKPLPSIEVDIEVDKRKDIKTLKQPPVNKKKDSPKDIKDIYGELQNVELKKNEYEKLITKFGEKDLKERIERLSLYIASKGVKYKSHYATILSWAVKDPPRPPDLDSCHVCHCSLAEAKVLTNTPQGPMCSLCQQKKELKNEKDDGSRSDDDTIKKRFAL